MVSSVAEIKCRVLEYFDPVAVDSFEIITRGSVHVMALVSVWYIPGYGVFEAGVEDPISLNFGWRIFVDQI